ncbi:hypothetical protein EP331_09840 [bacterium]|nr:MAG: hypothetical protein EP331_09840 [bacterium]
MKFYALLWGIIVLMSQSGVWAQQVPITIKASELQAESKKHLGNEQYWPILSNLATYQAESNTFLIKIDVQKKLSEFKQEAEKVEKGRNLYFNLIKNGAKVFASKELTNYDNSYNLFQKAVKDGVFDTAINEAKQLDASLKALKIATETNRKEAVSAILASKTGDVFKRKGIISNWDVSEKGDLYQEQDGIKTLKKSYAKLDFTDGSFVMINPETIATVKTSKIDKLSNTSETEIQISDGGLLASLSAKSRQSTEFVVKAADSETRVNSSKFWAEKGAADRVTYSNYEGEAIVRVASAEVMLGKDEGTIVERGKEPLPPVKLLTAPLLTWPASDSLTYDPVVYLTWSTVSEASRYEIEFSPSPAFTYGIKRYESKTTSLKVDGIEEGTIYIRLRAYDKLGLRGTDSPNYRLLKNKDTQAPALFFKNGLSQDYFTRNEQFVLEGITEPGSVLKVNQTEVNVQNGGEFSISIPIQKPETPLQIEAIDRSQNKTTIQKRVVKIQPEQLWKLNWSTSTIGEKIRRAPIIQVSGKAYEPLLVEASVGTKVFKAECGQSWDWALQLQASGADFIHIRFIMKKTGEVIAEKQFILE